MAEPTLTLSMMDQYLSGVSKEIRVALRYDPALGQSMNNYEQAIEQLKLEINGFALRRLGISEGPEIGRILKEIRWAWLEQKIHTPAEEKQLMLQLTEQRRK